MLWGIFTSPVRAHVPAAKHLQWPVVTPPPPQPVDRAVLKALWTRADLRFINLQIKIWFQNRRTKWKRKYTNDLEMLAQQYYSSMGVMAPRPIFLGDRLWWVTLPSKAQWSLYVPHSGHYTSMYSPVVTICTAQWSYTYHPVVTICIASLTFNNSTFCPHTILWVDLRTAIISLYNINWLVSITETECVYCAVRAEGFTTPQVTLTSNELMTLATEARSKGTGKPTYNIRRSHTT